MADSLFQIRHLDRRQRRFKSLVAHLQAGAIDGLFERVAGEDAESMRHASLLRRLPNAARDLVHDDVVMRGIAAQQASEADDGVVFLGFSESAGSGRNLEGTGHAEDFDVPLFCPGSYKSVVGAAEQAVSYEFIETRDDNSEPKSGCVQFSGNSLLPNFLFGYVLSVSVSLW